MDHYLNEMANVDMALKVLNTHTKSRAIMEMDRARLQKCRLLL